MNDDHLKTLAQVRPFLDGTQDVEFSLAKAAKAATPTSHQGQNQEQKPRGKSRGKRRDTHISSNVLQDSALVALLDMQGPVYT